MSIQAGVGKSNNNDSYQAGYEACKIALEKGLVREKADLLIAFASVRFDQKELVRGIRDAGEGAPLVGCSDAGEITDQGPAQRSAVVMAIKTDRLRFYTGIGKDIQKGAKEAGMAVARSVKSKAGEDALRALIMFPDVLTGNGAEIVRGVLSELGEHFPVVGGAAGDDFLFEKTYQYLDGEVASGAVAGVGLAGNFSLGVGVRHGWIPIGIPMRVTKSEGSIVYELDGRPAVSIYEDYFGEQASDLRKEPLARMAITYPLGIKLPDMEEYLIRDPITADEKGAITCAAEIPEGSEIRLMIGSREKAVQAAQDAAKKLMKDIESDGARVKFLLIFNCIAREKLFGQQAFEEIETIKNIVGRDVPMLGFYTYGEQAPVGGEIRDPQKINSRFYNETVVMLGVGEK